MANPSWLTADAHGVTISVYVKPRASRTRITGVHGDALAIQLAAPPVDGEANLELISFLAKALKVPRSSVELVAGQTSKHKRVRATGVQPDAALASLSPGT
ncbi:MAG: DUF167 domain-containing protein [Myxococcota bacterium]